MPYERLGSADPEEVDEGIGVSKRMRKSQLEAEFEENQELTSEMKSFS
jgi:hypothetical protein